MRPSHTPRASARLALLGIGANHVSEPFSRSVEGRAAAAVGIRRYARHTGRAVVVVEHDMGFVRDLGVKVTCLAEGSVLAEGSIDFVSNDPKVIENYLGR